jgi:hypothetical protein
MRIRNRIQIQIRVGGGGGKSAKNVHPPWQNPRYAPGQWYRCRQGRLGCSEGGDGIRRPLQRLGGALERVGERLQRAGDTWKELSVKIHHT